MSFILNINILKKIVVSCKKPKYTKTYLVNCLFFFEVFFSSKTVSIHPFGTLLIFVSTTPLPLFIQALRNILSFGGCHSVEKVPFLWIALALSGKGGLN